MRKVQQRGLLSVVGVLGVVLLGLVGCGGTSGDGDSAGRSSRVTLQITTAEQTGGDTLRHAILPNALRAVPTDPSDPAFVSRLDVEVTGTDITSAITGSATLDATQQETGTTVDLVVPIGPNRHITVDAFNTAGTRIFSGETTADVLGDSVTVLITLRRVFAPAAVTPSALANKAFAFADGAAFGILEQTTLVFGTFTDNTGPFTLTSTGQTATGNITLLPPPSADTLQQTGAAGTPRQGETSTRCNFSVETSGFSSAGGPQTGQALLMQPCETDVLDGNLILVNAATGLSSTSGPPVDIPVVLPPVVPLNTVRIGSPPGPVASGQMFTVPVEFNAGETAIISYLLELTFDPNVVEVLDIAGVVPFDDVVTNPLVFGTGAVRFAANNEAFTSVNGPFVLANVTFQVIGNSGARAILGLNFPPTPGGQGAIVNDAFAPIVGVALANGLVVVQ